MATQAWGPSRNQRYAWGFVAGALAVPVFHQLALAALHSAGIAKGAAFSMQPWGPLGVPRVLSLTFWGGVWGVVLAALTRGSRGGSRFLVFCTVFGALVPTLVAWFVVAPLKGQRVALDSRLVLTGLCIDAAWGLGTALFLTLFLRRSR